jgi:hypothetical protein
MRASVHRVDLSGTSKSKDRLLFSLFELGASTNSALYVVHASRVEAACMRKKEQEATLPRPAATRSGSRQVRCPQQPEFTPLEAKLQV